MNSFDWAQTEVSLSGTNIFKLLPGNIFTPMRGAANGVTVICGIPYTTYSCIKDTLFALPVFVFPI